MTLAIKCIYKNNLPPHLSYVFTLPDITQKLKRNNNELKHWQSWSWDCIPEGFIDKAIDQSQTQLGASIKAKGRHFEHLLW